MSWKEIGQRLGISDTRVEQIHDAAMRKIRNELRRDRVSNRNLADHIGSAPVEGSFESERTGRFKGLPHSGRVK